MFHRTVLEIGPPAIWIPGSWIITALREVCRLLAAGERAVQGRCLPSEGVMGYYDGLGGQSEKASTYEVAKVTETPVILVVDGEGASVSLAAWIQGMMTYRKDSNIQGILLNKVSGGYYPRLKELLEQECQIPVLGYLPEKKELVIPSRHLGLVSPKEMEAFDKWIEEVADILEETVEWEKLEKIAEGSATPLRGGHRCSQTARKSQNRCGTG